VFLRCLTVLYLLLVATGAADLQSQPAAANPDPSFLYTVAKVYEPLAWMRGEERFPKGAALFIKDPKSERPLLPDFVSSTDPVVSFDGQRVLFAGKARAADPWQIWEMSLKGGPPRRIPTGAEDCIRPLYLPEDRIVYARKIHGHFVIEALDLSGGKPLALTPILASAMPGDILHDGRIVFSAGNPLGTGDTPEIYTVYSDGSGVESYRCDHGSARYSAKQDASGDLIFVSAKGLGRFTSARAQGMPLEAPAGEFAGDFAETTKGEWLLSWRPDSNSTFRIMRWQQGSQRMEPVISEPGASVLQPALIASRPVPNRHPSGLHDWPNGNLLCLNAYTSKFTFAPGSIHSVRVYTRDEGSATRLLGSAPVESDGSFFVQVPGDQPLQIELLDAAGKSLKRESGFFWMRRGEQRGCVGCHAGPETAPENAVPAVLLKSATPADLTGNAHTSSGGH
jgi:Hydrazine synthase alpha subunit middle domain